MQLKLLQTQLASVFWLNILYLMPLNIFNGEFLWLVKPLPAGSASFDYKFLLWGVCLVFCHTTVLQHLKGVFVEAKPLSACHAATRCHEKPHLASRWLCSGKPLQQLSQVIVLEPCVLKASLFTMHYCSVSVSWRTCLTLGFLLKAEGDEWLLTYPGAANVEVP